MIDDTEDADATNQHGKGVAAKAAATVKAKMTKEQMQKATDYVAGGGDISAIESKYNVTAAQKKILEAAVKVNA